MTKEITSPEQRARFVCGGWQPFERMNGRTAEFFVKGEWVAGIWRDEGPLVTSGKDGRPAPMSVWLEVASILGQAPPGYVLVPEDVAQKGLRHLEAAKREASQYRWRLEKPIPQSLPEDSQLRKTMEEARQSVAEIDALIAALSPKKEAETHG